MSPLDVVVPSDPRIKAAPSLWFVVCGLVFLAVASIPAFQVRRKPIDRNDWSVNRMDGSLATISSDDVRDVRIQIDRIAASTRDQVVATRRDLQVQRGRPYALRFRARGSSPRVMDVWISEDHAPWSSLGLFATASVARTWSTHEFAFVATQTDPNASVSLAVGDQTGTVEIRDLELQQRTWGMDAPPAVKARLFSSGEETRHELECEGSEGAVARIVGPCFELEPNRRYGVALRASSLRGGSIACRVVDGSSHEIVAETRFALRNDPQEYYFEFQAKRGTKRGQIELLREAVEGGFTFGEFTLIEP